jgi:hypothetical protein
MTTKLLATLLLALLHGAANAQDAAANAPVEASNLLGTAIFGFIFVGMCVGFVWLVWWNDKKQKQKQLKEQEKTGHSGKH